MSRVAIIGDVSGHAAVLAEALESIEVDVATSRLPQDLTVIQVGDLVHKGPAGNEAVALADRMMRANPASWLQLLGNHDLCYVGGPPAPRWSGRGDVSDATIDVLRDWWHNRRCLLAVGLESVGMGHVLVSHAGLTRGCWEDLGRPSNVASAATAMNAEVGRPGSVAMRAGRLLGGPPDHHAGPCWAEVSQEVYEPWIEAGDIPFNQVHGHAAPWNFQTAAFWRDTPAGVRDRCAPDPEQRRVLTQLGPDPTKGRWGLSIDWQLGPEPPGATWPVLVVEVESVFG